MDRRRLAELFEQAIECAGSERDAWIEHACAGDRELRDELERLLRADAQAGNFLDTPALLIDAASPAEPAPQAFGPWRVLRALGSGGMGDVWLAERADGAFEQRVAIKQLAWPTPGLLQRFAQERRILARLEHPLIARLLDAGVDARERPYLVMEYVDGEPITRYAASRGVDLRGRLRLFARVCGAVQFAHQSLVVHRDLKPSNILVAADGTPKLLDFGIAKVLATTDDAAAATATRLLTPGYAAPEQFRGEPVTTATDVYALGVVLYELLCGRRPPPASADASGAPPPPSTAIDRSQRALRRAVRGDLDRIVLTALASDPGHRYATVAAFAADVERHLDGRPIAVRRTSVAYRVGKFARRHRYAVAFGAGLAIVVAVAGALYAAQLRRALAEGARAEAVREFLTGVFRQANPDENHGRVPDATQLLVHGEDALARVTQPDIAADLLALIAGLYWDVGATERAQALLPRLEAAAADTALPAAIRARALNLLARVEVDQRKLEAGARHARAALALVGGADSAEASTARHLLGNALAGSGDPGAETFLRKLLADDSVRAGGRSDDVADDLLLLGITLDMAGRPVDAAAAMERQLAIARALHGERHSTVSNGLNMLAIARQHAGDFDGAEAAFRDAISIETLRLGADSPQTLVIRSNLLDVVDQRGDFGRALPERVALLTSERAALGGSLDEQIAMDTQALGYEYLELGRFDEAGRTLGDALAIWTRVQGSNDAINSARPLELLGLALQWHGDLGESERRLRHAADILHAAKSPAEPRVRAELGDVLRLQGRRDEARTELTAAAAVPQADASSAVVEALGAELAIDAGDGQHAVGTAAHALAIARKAFPAHSARLRIPLAALARADLAIGDAAAADELLREARAACSPPYPASDPRVVALDVLRVRALELLGRTDEAAALRRDAVLRLGDSSAPYLVALRRNLDERQ